MESGHQGMMDGQNASELRKGRVKNRRIAYNI